MKRALLLAAAFLSCSIATAGIAHHRYFAASSARDRDHDAFREEWFGQRLRQRGEPVLFGPRALAGYELRLRLLVRRYHTPSYAIRIDEGAHGPRLTFVELDSAAFNRPAHVARRLVRRLTDAQWQSLDAMLGRTVLASLPAYALPRPPRRLADGSQEIEMCVHSTSFVLELVDRTGTHLVECNPCDMTADVAALPDSMIALRPQGAEDDRSILAEQLRPPD